MATESSVMAVIRASRPSFRNPHDRIAFSVHATFLAAGFSLIATGNNANFDNRPTDGDEVGIEGWNELDGSYGFAYTKTENGSKKTVVVKCLAIGNVLKVDMLNLRRKQKEPFNLQINVKDHTADSAGGASNYAEMYKNLQGIVNNLNAGILAKQEPMVESSSSAHSTEKSEHGTPDKPDVGFPVERQRLHSGYTMMASEIAKWSPRDESVFIHIMAEHVRKGNRTMTTFTPKAWVEIIHEFKGMTGNNWKKEQFRNKFNKLRTLYREFKKLRDEPTGFGWDPISKNVTASDDVWEKYLRANPNAKQFKNKGCAHFDELDRIYGDATALGAGTRASTQAPIDSDDNDNDPGIGESRNPQHDLGDDFEVEDGIRVALNAPSRSRTPTSGRCKRRADNTTFWDTALMAFNEAERERVEAEHASARGKAPARVYNPFSVQNATELLAAIPDVPIALYIKAGERMIADAGFREFFISSPARRRKEMLENMP